MADAETLAALFGGINQSADASDIDSFRKTLAANSMWRVAAQPVLNAQFNTATWTPGQIAGTAAGQAFLGAALNAIADRSEAAQMQKVASVLPSLYAKPENVEAPEGVDPEAFAGLKLSAMSRGQKGSAATLAKLAQDLYGVGVAEKTAAAQEKGKVEGRREAYGSMGMADPEDPAEQKLVELRNKLDASDASQNFKIVNRLSQQLANTMKNPSAVADPIIAKLVVQFAEPQRSAREGTAVALQESDSIPEQWKGTLAQALEGKSKLGDDTKAQLLQIAQAAYDAHANAFNSELKFTQSEGSKFGIDPSRFSSVGTPQPFQSVIGAGSNGGGNVDMSVLRAERDKLKSQGKLNDQEIANALRLKFGGLVQ